MGTNVASLLEETWLLVFCTCVFIAIYMIGFFGIFPCWKLKYRLEASSCCMSLLHGTPASLAAAYSLLRTPWKLDAPNTAYQERVMEFSVAYFLVDLLHYVLFVPDEFLFILHHVFTTTYILSCRYYTKHGAVSVMALLGLAECTSLFQNVWTLLGLASGDSFAARRIYHSLYPAFITLFTFVRGILGPCLTWKLCKFYLTGQADSVISRWLVSYWMTTVILAVSGSIFWVSRLWVRFVSFYKDKVYADAKSSKFE